MNAGDYVRIGTKYATQHKYDYAVGCGGKIYSLSQLTKIPYAVINLVQEPPEGKPHRLLIPLEDLQVISEQQAQFRLIK